MVAQAQLMEEAKETPSFWFLVLERARQQNDFAAAAQAQRELERLGVRVTYKPATRARKVVTHAAS